MDTWMDRGFLVRASLVAMVLVVLGALPAMACSCATGDPRDALEEADAAIVGRLLSIADADAGDGDEVYTFAVKVAVKGTFGATVEVRTPANGAACGLEVRIGERTGLFLTDDHGTWTSGLCAQIEGRVLLRAAEPLPPPDGEGPVRFVVGGNMGPNRLVALDRHARVLAYGVGDGYALDVEGCPGGRFVVESAVVERPSSPPRLGRVVVRRSTGLRPVWSETVLRAKFPSIYEVSCLNRRGGRILAVEHHEREWFVHEIGRAGMSVVWRGDARTAFLDGERPLVIRRRAVFAVDLSDGSLRRLMSVPAGVDRVAFSPDRRSVAMFQRGAAFDPNRDSRIIVFHRSSGDVSSYTFGNGSSWGEPTWADARTLVHLPRSGRVQVFHVDAGDPTLDLASSFGQWTGAASAIEGGTVFGVGWGILVKADLATGPVRRVRRFESPELYGLEVFPKHV